MRRARRAEEQAADLRNKNEIERLRREEAKLDAEIATEEAEALRAKFPPAWHPDPNGIATWRWWDGTKWTDKTA